MLSAEQKTLIRGMVELRIKRIELHPKSSNVVWAKSMYQDAIPLIYKLGIENAVGQYQFFPKELSSIYTNMSNKDLKRVVEVSCRIMGGNLPFHQQGYCNSCMTGIWVDGECTQCTSQAYPGRYNARTLCDVKTSKEQYLDMIGVYFKDHLEADVYYGKVFSLWGQVSLQKNIIQFVSDHVHDDRVDILDNRKIKGQLAIRSRLSNRGIQHSHLNDQQLVKAVWSLLSVQKSLRKILAAA